MGDDVTLSLGLLIFCALGCVAAAATEPTDMKTKDATPATPARQSYVSPDGNDAWSGRLRAPNAARTDGPFRTLKKAAGEVQPGATCFLRKGTYRETLKPARSGEPGKPIVFRNYEDETAVISGADVLTDWVPDGDRIAAAPMPWDLRDQNQLFADGALLTEARWPKNTGTLLQPVRAAAQSGTEGTLTDPALPGGDGAWTGAVLWCAGGYRWICWSETVTGYDAATHTLSFKMTVPDHWYTVGKGSAYVLMGARAALQDEGEWWYDRARQRMLLIPPRGLNLASAVIEAKRRQHCIDLAGVSHVQVIGLRFRAGGVFTDDATSNILLSRCTGEYVSHSYLRDVGLESGVLICGRDNEVNSCELSGSSSSILRVAGSGHRIVNCYFHDGNYAAKWNGAVALSGRKILFSHNTVRDSGRDLVTMHGLMESLVQYNDLSNAGWLTCDLGMLYGHSTDFMNTVIRYNVVHDNRAAGCALGIYFDHCSHNAIVHHNVIYKVAGDPIRVNNPSFFDLVFNNSCFATGGTSTFDHSHRDDLFGLRYTDNIVNQPIALPKPVVVEHNLVSADPGYVDPAQGHFNFKPGSSASGVGAFPAGVPVWRAGHDFANPPTVVWEAPDVDWMNVIRNACFELGTLEGWTAIGPGKAELTTGNGWGNPVSGSKTFENTGTSRYELRLGKGRAGVEQIVKGLRPGTPHVFSGWLKVSADTESVRLGVRTPGGAERWSTPVTTTAWTRVSVAFTTGPAPCEVTVRVQKSSDGAGYAYCDNLGLPRAKE